MISLDGFLPAQLTATQNKNGRDNGDNAADEDPEFAIAVFVHDIISNACTADVFRFPSPLRREFGKNRCRNRAISWNTHCSYGKAALRKRAASGIG